MKCWHTYPKPENYLTSSDKVIADIEELGVDAFRFDILFTCRNKSELRGSEIALQVLENCIVDDNSYNKHVGHLLWMNTRFSKDGWLKVIDSAQTDTLPYRN